MDMDQMIYAIISVKSDQGKLDELLEGLKGDTENISNLRH
jgi:hypothetical protein